MKKSELKQKIKEVIKEELDEMARTAGTGNAIKLTDKGKQVLKDIKAGNQPPVGVRETHVKILVWLFKKEKEGKRVQKIDYAQEMGKPQPYFNGYFNELLKEGYIAAEGYTSIAQTRVTKAPTDFQSLVADVDDEEEKPAKPTKPRAKK